MFVFLIFLLISMTLHSLQIFASVRAVKLPLTSLKYSFLYTDWSKWLTCSWSGTLWSPCSICRQLLQYHQEIQYRHFHFSPLEVRSVRHTMIKWLSLELLYMPSAEYSQYLPQPVRLPTNSKHFSSQCYLPSLSFSTVRFFITFPIFNPSQQKANLCFACCAILYCRKITPCALFLKKQLINVFFFT